MPVVYDDRQVLGEGRYLQQIRISVFPPSSRNPEGLRYALCLVDQSTDEVVLLYDVHPGKGHHRHVRGHESPYAYRGADALVADFLHDIELVLGGKL